MILLEKQLEKYQPYNEQEEKDLMVIQKLLAQESDIFERSCLFAHMTASAWVVNREKTKVLMAYHKIYDSWAWLGGTCGWRTGSFKGGCTRSERGKWRGPCAAPSGQPIFH